jgi:hypothetical protein
MPVSPMYKNERWECPECGIHVMPVTYLSLNWVEVATRKPHQCLGLLVKAVLGRERGL